MLLLLLPLLLLFVNLKKTICFDTYVPCIGIQIVWPLSVNSVETDLTTRYQSIIPTVTVLQVSPFPVQARVSAGLYDWYWNVTSGKVRLRCSQVMDEYSITDRN